MENIFIFNVVLLTEEDVLEARLLRFEHLCLKIYNLLGSIIYKLFEEFYISTEALCIGV